MNISHISKTCLVLLAIALLAAPALGREEALALTAAGEGPEKPRIEVVFVLDTTGSMHGLIDAAKQKIWAIANTMVSATPTPTVSIGLVAYRDRGDEYVTKVIPLTRDLDAVHSALMEFSAAGGGDMPESVNQALHEAVTEGGWSKGRGVYRVIFLVGDAPPHMDYQDDVKYHESCKIAATAGITINTIQCGNIPQTTPIWQEIAKLAEGQFFQLQQSGNAVIAETPFDKGLVSLSLELDATRIYYGTAEDRAIQKTREGISSRIYDKAAPTAQAARAVFNAGEAGEANFAGHKELLNDLQLKAITLDKIPEEQLPEELRKMTPAERARHIEAQQQKRQQLQKQIRELADKRQEHLRKTVAEAEASGAAPSLDATLYRAVREQGGKAAGLKYTADAPQY